jgi:hypothetical protein
LNGTERYTKTPSGEVRQKTADSLMLVEQFLEIGIVRRCHELLNILAEVR